MKRFSLILVVSCLILCSTGCDGVLKVENISDPFTHGITPTTEPVTEPPVTTEETRPPMATAPNFEEMTEPTFPEATEPETSGANVLYIVNLRAGVPIYSQPDFDSPIVQTIEIPGPYTIVDEVWDNMGNKWGKLKSGLGWVILSGASSAPSSPSGIPYTVKLLANTPIYKRPDLNSAFVDYVGKAGTYTIVEEALDDNGNLWGKLKSGLGWIPLY